MQPPAAAPQSAAAPVDRAAVASAQPCIDFSVAVNPLGLHPAAKEALLQLAAEPCVLERYPDARAEKLSSLLSCYWQLSPACVVCGAGASDLLCEAVRAFAKKRVVIVGPASAAWQSICEKNGCQTDALPLSMRTGFSFTAREEQSLSWLLGTAGSTDMLLLALPGNPTGVILGTDVLLRIAALCEARGIYAIFDASYAQFSAQAEEALRAVLARLSQFPHLIVLNTLSTFYGMPGLRAGYALCGSEAVCAHLCEFRRAWAVSTPALVLSEAVLRAELSELEARAQEGSVTDWTERTRKLVVEERQYLATAFSALGYTVAGGGGACFELTPNFRTV